MANISFLKAGISESGKTFEYFVYRGEETISGYDLNCDHRFLRLRRSTGGWQAAYGFGEAALVSHESRTLNELKAWVRGRFGY
jgi:hypothetical protein